MLLEEGQQRVADGGEGQREEEEEPGNAEEELDLGLVEGARVRGRRVVRDHVGEGDAGAEGGDADDGGEEAVEEDGHAGAAVAGHGLDACEAVAAFLAQTGGAR